MGTTSLSTAMVRTIKRGSTIGYYRSVTNRISSFTIEKILFWVDTWYRTALCLRGCDQLCSGKLRWVRRKMYSTGCKRYPLSRIQPLVAPLKAKRRASSPCTGEPRFALRCRGALRRSSPAAVRSDLPQGTITRASQFRKIKNSFKEIKI